MIDHLQEEREYGPRLWAIVGATGTGKTSLSLELADLLGERGHRAEIINADAMQLYRGMNIGTAKLPEQERRGIPHHLFDVREVTEEATVAWYQPVARRCITEVHARGSDAILVGGSGLYVSSVVFDFQFPARDEELRAELEREMEVSGISSLLERLRALSPQTANAVDVHNPRRVVRALEVALLGGEAQVQLPEAPTLWHESTVLLGTGVDRAALVERLDRRVEDMWREGMIDEVRGLVHRGIEAGKTASRAIGYAQALAQLHGDISEQEAIVLTQQLTRRYARRQVSWFRRYAGVRWLDTKYGLPPRADWGANLS